MNSTIYNIWRLRDVALVILVTALINALLFAGLPWLTQVAEREQETKMVTPYLLTPRRAPKVLEPDRERRLRQQELRQAPKPENRSRSTERTFNRPDLGFEFGEGGFGDGLALAMIDPGAFGIDMDGFGFDLSQVDKPPRWIRKPRPIYPFVAQRKGLKGWVMMKFLVGKDGQATRVRAVRSDPEDILEVFGPACVKAVEKSRFAPGEIGGDPVPTKVTFKFHFEIDY